MIIKFIIPFIGLGIVIAFHELGHLLMAKLLKIKVEVFSVGIGKKLFSVKKAGTEYAISAIPLGGYCKLKGGDLHNPNRDKDSMDTAHPLKKILIYIAGPVFNIIFASIIMTIFYIIPGHEIVPSKIVPITGSNYPGEEAGLLKGDIIVSINGHEVETFDDISALISDKELPFRILREGATKEITITPRVINGRSFIGIYPYIPLKVLRTTPFNKLKKGDQIKAVNGSLVDNYYELLKVVDKAEEFTLTVLRDGKILESTLTIREVLDTGFTEVRTYNIFQSILNGNRDTYLMLRQIISVFAKLFKTGEIGKSISSPIGLVYEVGNSIDNIYSSENILFTLQIILSIIASISLTLGFINLLPIPILDGGQIFINIISIIKRSPLKPSILLGYQTVGLIIVLLLFILGINNDIFSILENK